MRILYLIDKPFALFGAEHHFLDLISYQKNINEICCVILQDGILGERLKGLGITTIVIEWPRFGSTESLLNRLQSVIQEFNPDLVHSHKPTATYYGSLVCKRANIKHVSTIHAIPWHTAANKKGFKRIASFLFHLKLQYFSEKRSIINIFVSQKSLNNFAIFKTKAKCIYNWLSPRFNSNCDYKILNGEYKFLCVSSLVKTKGIVEVIELFMVINKIYPMSVLTIVGESSDREYKMHLIELVNKYKLERSVTFVGYQNELREYYENSNVFISLTKGETFGLVFVEAMYFGLPIISSDMKILREIIHSENLFLKFNENINQFELKSFLNVQNLKKISIINRMYAKSNFNFEIQQKKLNETYHSVLFNSVK